MEIEKLKLLGENDYYTYDLGDEVLFIHKTGFSLFNKKKRRYIIDASIWNEEKKIRVGDKEFKIYFTEIMETREIKGEEDD